MTGPAPYPPCARHAAVGVALIAGTAMEVSLPTTPPSIMIMVGALGLPRLDILLWAFAIGASAALLAQATTVPPQARSRPSMLALVGLPCALIAPVPWTVHGAIVALIAVDAVAHNGHGRRLRGALLALIGAALLAAMGSPLAALMSLVGLALLSRALLQRAANDNLPVAPATLFDLIDPRFVCATDPAHIQVGATEHVQERQ